MILNGPTSRNREGSDQVSVEAKQLGHLYLSIDQETFDPNGNGDVQMSSDLDIVAPMKNQDRPAGCWPHVHMAKQRWTIIQPEWRYRVVSTMNPATIVAPKLHHNAGAQTDQQAAGLTSTYRSRDSSVLYCSSSNGGGGGCGGGGGGGGGGDGGGGDGGGDGGGGDGGGDGDLLSVVNGPPKPLDYFALYTRRVLLNSCVLGGSPPSGVDNDDHGEDADDDDDDDDDDYDDDDHNDDDWFILRRFINCYGFIASE
ncbi:hypothetical protein ANN_11437 [Periplaneta americana]|uniref:Uncharacterized protein n=1 Tax=Periplaneta americana TaxID=6978 RepID=A0ABQ8T506_PERAM|nr:hypothetical protein ANN_11437 [Periplaneta americana]